MILWYDVTFKHLLLVAAASLLPCVQGLGARYQVVPGIYGSGPGYVGSSAVTLIQSSVDLRGRDDISNR